MAEMNGTHVNAATGDERARREQEARLWRVVDEIRAQNADKDPDEIVAEVTAEIEAYRREQREQRRHPQTSRR